MSSLKFDDVDLVIARVINKRLLVEIFAPYTYEGTATIPDNHYVINADIDWPDCSLTFETVSLMVTSDNKDVECVRCSLMLSDVETEEIVVDLCFYDYGILKSISGYALQEGLRMLQKDDKVSNIATSLLKQEYIAKAEEVREPIESTATPINFYGKQGSNKRFPIGVVDEFQVMLEDYPQAKPLVVGEFATDEPAKQMAELALVVADGSLPVLIKNECELSKVVDVNGYELNPEAVSAPVWVPNADVVEKANEFFEGIAKSAEAAEQELLDKSIEACVFVVKPWSSIVESGLITIQLTTDLKFFGRYVGTKHFVFSIDTEKELDDCMLEKVTASFKIGYVDGYGYILVTLKYVDEIRKEVFVDCQFRDYGLFEAYHGMFDLNRKNDIELGYSNLGEKDLQIKSGFKTSN